MVPRLVCVRRLAWSLGLVVFVAAAGAPPRAQQDREAGSDVVGHLMRPRGAMPLIGIAPADQRAIRTIAERLWAIALRNPALNPPTGFNFRPSLIGHGYAQSGVPRGVPYTCSASGYLYWYVFQPGIDRVEALPVAMHAFFVHANRLSIVFTGEPPWQSDASGEMYWEPREMRRVGGYPQYENGVIVLTNTPRPLWRPVPRERLLRWELGTQRASLESTIKTERESSGYDPQANLDAWLRDRPKRQQANDELYQTTRKRDPKLAEDIRAKLAKSEEATERSLREIIVRHAEQRPLLDRQGDKRREQIETCVRYLEGELTRLSAAERGAPGYLSATGGNRASAPPNCSSVVEPDFPGARRIVEQNWAFFDSNLPRTAVQAILIDFSNFESFGKIGGRQRTYVALRDGMDYQALAAMLAKR